MKRTAKRRVYWALKARGPCADNVLEKMLSDLPASSVRWARLSLERSGAARAVGWTKDRRKVFVVN